VNAIINAVRVGAMLIFQQGFIVANKLEAQFAQQEADKSKN